MSPKKQKKKIIHEGKMKKRKKKITWEDDIRIYDIDEDPY